MFRKSDFYNNNIIEGTEFNQYRADVVVADIEQERFNQLVFAPDPETGNPVSEVYYLLHGTDEGFKQYIKERLFNSSGIAALADSSDDALALVKPNLMTQSQYLEQVHNYVRDVLKPKQESEVNHVTPF